MACNVLRCLAVIVQYLLHIRRTPDLSRLQRLVGPN